MLEPRPTHTLNLLSVRQRSPTTLVEKCYTFFPKNQASRFSRFLSPPLREMHRPRWTLFAMHAAATVNATCSSLRPSYDSLPYSTTPLWRMAMTWRLWIETTRFRGARPWESGLAAHGISLHTSRELLWRTAAWRSSTLQRRTRRWGGRDVSHIRAPYLPYTAERSLSVHAWAWKVRG